MASRPCSKLAGVNNQVQSNLSVLSAIYKWAHKPPTILYWLISPRPQSLVQDPVQPSIIQPAESTLNFIFIIQGTQNALHLIFFEFLLFSENHPRSATEWEVRIWISGDPLRNGAIRSLELRKFCLFLIKSFGSKTKTRTSSVKRPNSRLNIAYLIYASGRGR